MLHIGYFSFDETAERQKPRHGYFSCIIDAEDPEAAVARFGEHILGLKKKEPAFRNVTAVYIEDIIRVADVPKESIVTRLQSCEGEFPRSISHSLPGVIKDGIEAFGLPSNVDRHERSSEEAYSISDPFIRFD